MIVCTVPPQIVLNGLSYKNELSSSIRFTGTNYNFKPLGVAQMRKKMPPSSGVKLCQTATANSTLATYSKN